MKKYLLGTSGLVAAVMLAHPASAADNVKFGVRGFMEMYVGFYDAEEDAGANTRTYDSFGIESDTEVHFRGSTTLENGLKLGYRVELETNRDREAVSVDEVFLDIASNSLGLLRIGDDPVSALVATGAPKVGAGLADADDWLAPTNVLTDPDWIGNGPKVDGHGGADDNLKVSYWTPSDWEKATGLQASFSIIPNMDRGGSGDGFVDTQATNGLAWAGALTFDRKIGDIDTYISYGYYTESDSVRTGGDTAGVAQTYEGHNVGIELGMGAWEFGAGYQRTINKIADRNAAAGSGNDSSSHDGWSWNVGGAYKMGKWTLGLAYNTGEVDDDTASPENDSWDIIEFAVEYDLGSGVEWDTSLYHVKWDDETGVDNNYSSGGWALVTGLVLGF